MFQANASSTLPAVTLNMPTCQHFKILYIVCKSFGGLQHRQNIFGKMENFQSMVPPLKKLLRRLRSAEAKRKRRRFGFESIRESIGVIVTRKGSLKQKISGI
jgi:hypothetical protein